MQSKVTCVMLALRILLTDPSFARFVLVGSVGFCIDGGLLTVLAWSGWDLIAARAVSFLAAVTATWVLNRMWTFTTGIAVSKRREYFYYLAAQVGGALINLAVFFALISAYPQMRAFPLLPLSIGSVIALFFNYTVSRKFVFKRVH